MSNDNLGRNYDSLRSDGDTEQSTSPGLTALERLADTLPESTATGVIPGSLLPKPPGTDDYVDQEVSGDHARRLPDSIHNLTAFRDLLFHSRRYALLYLANPHGFLGSLICETASVIDPKHVVRTKNRNSHMNAFGLIVELTGRGKGNLQYATGMITDPVMEDVGRIRTVSGLASGQGLQDAFSGPVLDENDETATYLKGLLEQDPSQVAVISEIISAVTRSKGALGLIYDAIVLRYDEGRKLLDTMNQQHSTLASDFISLITGGGIDSVRAHDRGNAAPRVAIKPGSVRLCGTAGIQPAYLASLSQDSEQGMAKRLLKLPAGFTKDELDEAMDLRSRDLDDAMSKESEKALRQYVVRASQGGTIRVSQEVQVWIDSTLSSSVVDTGWVGVSPQGQQLSLQLSVAGIVSRMIGRQQVEMDAVAFADAFLQLSREMEERYEVYAVEQRKAKLDETLNERASGAIVQRMATGDAERMGSLLSTATRGIYTAVVEAGEVGMTGRELRNYSGANSNTLSAYKACVGQDLHMAAIRALEADHKIVVEKSGRGIRVAAKISR